MVMNDRVKQLFAQAQQLSPEEQAELLDMLLAIAPDQPVGWEKAWAEEAERRWQAYQCGEMKSALWEEVKARRSKA